MKVKTNYLIIYYNSKEAITEKKHYLLQIQKTFFQQEKRYSLRIRRIGSIIYPV